MSDLSWIYIIRNPSFPSYIKVGWTRNNPYKRMSEIDSTGVPTPFDLIYAACTDDAGRLEKIVHNELHPDRVRAGREFFETSVANCIDIIRASAKSNGIQVYFEKAFLEGEVDLDLDLDDPDAAFERRTAIVREACFSYDFDKVMNSLADCSKCLEGICALDEVFSDQQFSDFLNSCFTEEHDREFGSKVVDFDCERFTEFVNYDFEAVRLFQWISLPLGDTEALAKKFARHFIRTGKNPKIKLVAANYLFEFLSSEKESMDEILQVYLHNLKEDQALTSGGDYHYKVRVVLQAFIRLCWIVIKFAHREHFGLILRLCDFYSKNVGCFDRRYPGVRSAIENHIVYSDLNESSPLGEHLMFIADIECE